MTIFELQSRAVGARRRLVDWNLLGPALMFAATLCGIVLLLVFVDRAEATDDAFVAPVAMVAGAAAKALPAHAVAAAVKADVVEEVRETWSSDTSSAGTRPDSSH